jgi:uncharacterized delta-60 repeat protein
VVRYTSVYTTGMVLDTDRVVLTGLCTYGVVFYRTCLQAFDSSGNVLAGFGSGGFVDAYLSSASATESASVIAATPDGKLLVAGYCESTLPSPNMCLARYLATGELDVSFNGTGYFPSIPGLKASSLAMDGDKIVVASVCGQAFCVTRLNSDGSRDLSFNGSGTVTTTLPTCGGATQSMAVQSLLVDGGTVLLSGACRGNADLYHRPVLVRYLTDGNLDTSLNGSGILVAIPELAIDPGVRPAAVAHVGGKIMIAARSYYSDIDKLRIVRYSNDGTPDTAYGATGSVVHSIGVKWLGTNALVPYGTKVVIVGSCEQDYSANSGIRQFCLVRLNGDGTLDSSFNGTGYTIQKIGPLGGSPISVAVHGDKLVVNGLCQTTLCVAVFNPDGSLDTALAPAGSRVLTAAGLLEVAAGLIVANGKATIAGQCYGKYSADLCLVRIELPSSTFTVGVPSPPAIVSALPGDATATITFKAPASNGGSPILDYAATCEPGAISVTATSSPVVVSGLVNGTNYTCRVAATNSVGTGQSSPVQDVTPSVLSLLAAFSRKTHGAAGQFDLPLDVVSDIMGNVTVESRAAGPAHTIAFQFNRAFSSTGSVTAVSQTGSSIPANAVAGSGNELIVTLTGVGDGSRATVSLVGVGGELDASISLGFLVGDVNDSRSVNATDISGVKARAGQVTNASNFRFDLNASGGINATDIAAVKSRAGLVLP